MNKKRKMAKWNNFIQEKLLWTQRKILSNKNWECVMVTR